MHFHGIWALHGIWAHHDNLKTQPDGIMIHRANRIFTPGKWAKKGIQPLKYLIEQTHADGGAEAHAQWLKAMIRLKVMITIGALPRGVNIRQGKLQRGRIDQWNRFFTRIRIKDEEIKDKVVYSGHPWYRATVKYVGNMYCSGGVEGD